MSPQNQAMYGRFLDKLKGYADDLPTRLYRTQSDEGAVTAAVVRLYRRMKLDPPTVLWCDDPWQLAALPLLLQMVCLLFQDYSHNQDETLQEWVLSNQAYLTELGARFTDPRWYQAYTLIVDKLKATRDLPFGRLNSHPDLFKWLDLGANPYPKLLTQFALESIGLPTHRFAHTPQESWQSLWQRVDQTELVVTQSAHSVRLPLLTDTGQSPTDFLNFARLAPGSRNFGDQTLTKHLCKQLEGTAIGKRLLDRSAQLTKFGLSWGRWSPSGRSIPLEVVQALCAEDVAGDLAEELNEFIMVRDGAFMYIFMNGVVFACRNPVAIRLDNQRRLHCYESPAMEFPNGYSICCWRGIPVSQDLIANPSLLTEPYIRFVQNVELRYVLIERYGIDKYNHEAGATVVDRNSRGVLYRMGSGRDSLLMVQVTNSTPEPDGSYKKYFLRVPPEMTSVEQAVAWTFGLEATTYQPAVET